MTDKYIQLKDTNKNQLYPMTSKTTVGIKVTTLPTGNYIGQPFTISGMVVQMMYSDGSMNVLGTGITTTPVVGTTITKAKTLVNVFYTNSEKIFETKFILEADASEV